MARFCPLFSSSSGNCIYIGSAREAILIDVGVSAKQTALLLNGFGIDISTIKGIFVTHEHNDHIQGVRPFARKYNVPVYASAGTVSAMEDMGILNGKFEVNIIEDSVEIGNIRVERFNTPHDCRESTGYTVNIADNCSAAVCTDLGIVTHEVRNALKGCSLVLLESNHDVSMLQNGAYPYLLKRRILSEKGHLSNDSCAEFVKELIKNGTTRFYLGHLSRENNFPELAYQTSLCALESVGAKLNRDFLLSVATPKCVDGITVF